MLATAGATEKLVAWLARLLSPMPNNPVKLMPVVPRWVVSPVTLS